MQISVDSFAEAYSLLRKELLEAPLVAPRGMKTKELLGTTIHLRNPRNRLGFHKDRGYSLPLMIAEAIMLFSDSDRLEHLAFINPRMKMYSDTGSTLFGAYGNRIHTNIQDVLRKLKDDSSTRQAVLPIIRPYDLRVVTKDFPCTQVLQLMIRDNKLHMFTTMRSNDFGWGLQYDLPVFTIFQEILANTLQVEVGEYWHTANSLHIYDYHFDLLEKIEALDPVEFEVHYELEHMNALSDVVSVIHKLQHTDLEKEVSQFLMILHSFLRRKQHLSYQRLPDYLDWANQFLEYELNNDK